MRNTSILFFHTAAGRLGSFRILVTALLSFFSFSVNAAFDFAGQSVLSSGKWIKISITESGIHQIAYKTLEEWGFAEPENVRIYGYGGALLPEDFRETFTDDLPPVPVYRDTQRQVLFFYAQGPVKWIYNFSRREFVHTNNCYSTQGYYFLTESEQPETRPVLLPQGSGETQTVTVFDDYLLHESELVNLGKTGRELYGESFLDTLSRTFDFHIPGITSDPANIRVEFVAKAQKNTPVTVHINDQKVIVATIPQASTSNHYEFAKVSTALQAWTPEETERYKVKIDYGGNLSDKIARLNFIRFTVKRQLRLYDGQVRFRNTLANTNRIRYELQLGDVNPENLVLWDVTDPKSIGQIPFSITGQTLSFVPAQTGVKEYVAFDTSASYPSPQRVGDVPNQNLHSLRQTDMVIIVHPRLRAEAERLAAHHRQKDGLTVTVIEPEPIYNEFSSGTPDATAYRLLMKMLYDRGGKKWENLRYLLLFGDATYDNRLLTPAWKNSDATLLLSYQTLASLSDTQSSVIDDYFGFLGDNSGTSLGKDRVETGIGRIPVRSVTEARKVVDKIIAYSDNTDYGCWKNDLCFIADDDASTDSANLHIGQSDSLARKLEKTAPEFFIHKIFLDSFLKEISGNMQTNPDARKKFYTQLDKGTLMVSYIGHGSTKGWAEENLLTVSDIRALSLTRLPLFVTATCDFSRYDDIDPSAGEELLLNPRAAIALFTTSRVVYADKNDSINRRFMEHIFSRRADGKRLRLGDIMRETKQSMTENGLNDENKLNFALLGDPAVTLAYPEYKIRITGINDQPVGNTAVLLRARQEISFTGEILNPDGSPATAFDGYVLPRLFDSKDSVTTLDNNKRNYNFTYTERNNLLYTGKEAVRNGTFTFTCRIPKEIHYSGREGLLNLYAYDQAGNEAQGSFSRFNIGETDYSLPVDTEGPEIRTLALDDPGFHSGQPVGETPLLIAEIEDPSGIHIAERTIGQNITLQVNNGEKTYFLNRYFSTDPDQNGKKGTLRFPIPALAPGRHTLTLKVWDNEGNSSAKSISCEVRQGYVPQHLYLAVSDNPAKESATFILTHNRTGQSPDIEIGVWTPQGEKVWEYRRKADPASGSVSVPWALTGQDGRRLKPGTYFYRATVSSDDSRETTDFKKIVVLTQ